MNLEKLKDSARKFEQKEEWRKAIDVYLKAIQQVESGAGTSPDLSIYNRIGDLYLKVGDTAAAMRSYERAVDLYAEQGFVNNAIALCGKILRINSGRTQTYLKLAQLHARKNVVIEAKRYLLEFLDRMNALGQLDQAFESVKTFADQFSGAQEIRMMLVELLRAASREEDARQQLEKLTADFGPRGGADTRPAPERSPAAGNDATPGAPARPRAGELVFLDTGELWAPGAAAPAPPGTSGVEGPTGRGGAAPQPPSAAPAAPGRESPDSSGEETPAFESLIIEPLSPEPIIVEPIIVEPIIVEPIAFEPTGSAALSPDDVSLEGAAVEPIPFDPTAAISPADWLRADAVTVTPLDGLVPTAGAPETPAAEPPELAGDAGTGGGAGIAAPPPAALVNQTDAGAEDGAPWGSDEAEPAEDADPGRGLQFIDVGDEHAGGPPELRPAESVEPGGAVPAAEAPGGGAPAAPVAAPALEALEADVAADPESPAAHRALAEALAAAGERSRATEELALALAAYQAREEWTPAAEVAARLVELAPDDIRAHQRRVEVAYRMGEKGPLVEAYLALADLLARLGATDKAAAVYRRVREHDPENGRAEAALAALEPPAVSPAPAAPPAAAPTEPPAAAPTEASAPARAVAPAPPRAAIPEGFVDLGALVIDPEGPRDTRMRVEATQPSTDDEDATFRETLAEFKRGIEQNLDAADYESYYELGVAYKEMGLLEEAIAAFQKALRAPDGRLRTAEALGVAFFEQGRYPISEAVLRRAVDGAEGAEDAKIGLLYWLGRASEAQGKHADAIASYERAIALDIGFRDLSDRLRRLTAGRPA